MAINDLEKLLHYLCPFPSEVQEKALWLRNFIWCRYPQCNELVYDNYNAVAFGWSPTEKLGHTFCNVAIWRTNAHVILGFNWGSELTDPRHLLIGNGKQFRYLSSDVWGTLPDSDLENLIKEAYHQALEKVTNPAQIVQGKTIYKSESPVKRSSKKE